VIAKVVDRGSKHKIKKMFKNIATIIITIISFILIIIAASSCSLEKRLAKYCPLCVQKDSTITIIQVRDTTITIPGETITLIRYTLL
jgi:hypothetical protein